MKNKLGVELWKLKKEVEMETEAQSEAEAENQSATVFGQLKWTWRIKFPNVLESETGVKKQKSL